MAHFDAYNTSDSSTGNKLLKGNEQIILGPLQADWAQTVAGSVFAEQAGAIFVEQSFDYDWEWKAHGKAESEAGHWDISTEIAVSAKTAAGYTANVSAPVVRVRYVNGATEQKVGFRLFARTFTTGR